jgi:hypothetical protein
MLASSIFNNKWNMKALVYIAYEASGLPTLYKVHSSTDTENKFMQDG